MTITVSSFSTLLKKVAQTDTSSNPELWTSENPLSGHCAVASLVAQDYFGGDLVRGSLEGTKYTAFHSHYWNKLLDGTEVDFTQEQYPDLSFKNLLGEIRTRERVLAHPDTVRRYELLKKRFNGYIIKV